MKGFRLTAAATSDLDEIWFFIAQDNPEAADRFLDTLISTFITLGTQPLMGRERNDIRPGLRGFPLGNYLILYRDTDEYLEVLRVLHGARDIESS